MHIAHHPGQLELGLQKIVLVLSLQEKVVPIWQDREITEQDCKSERVKVSGSKSSGNNSFRDLLPDYCIGTFACSNRAKWR